ncbi:MAG: ATP-binding protein [Candidatus Nanohaloarchaeota archaeon QJJ-9]|nr:ATP-binding protein [Candidatus Nanohaloarchaeota archaeon QJJ-9]
MEDFIERDLLTGLEDHLEKDEITVIVGSRQVGKTTLMQLMKSRLESRDKKTLYLSLDIESDRRFFKSQEKLVEKLDLEFGEEKGYVFIDEIQRKKNAGLFLKGIYDRGIDHKLIVSGSGSLDLKEDIHESLAGRKRVFQLPPVTLREFIDYRTDYSYSDRLEKFTEVNDKRSKRLLEEYLNFGGYPRVVLAEGEEEKRRTMDEIFSSYLERDISNLLNLQKLDAFSELVSLLADQVGDLVSYSKLSRDLGIKNTTVKNYIEYMEKTFLLDRVRPFHSNRKKEIVKAPVAYFADPGLRNYAVGRFGSLQLPEEKGKVFESVVYNLLKQELMYTGYSIKYWRKKSGAELDFVLEKGDSLIAIEAKYSDSPNLTRSLRSFIDSYEPQRALVVNPSCREKKSVEGTSVELLPVFQLRKRLSEV